MNASELNPQIWDVFKLWEHYLIYWDSTKKEYLDKILKNKKIKSVITDPPYWVDYVKSKKWFYWENTNHKDIENDEFQSEEQYKEFTKKWLEIIKPYLDNKNSFYIFNSDKMIFSLKQAIEESNYKFTQMLIWVKNWWVIWRLDYLPQHELIAYGWYWKHEFLRSKWKSIFSYPKTKKNTIHPTMKPISLLRELILNSSHIWEYIYDPFLWSGSTIIACEQTKRKCIWVELEKEYILKILERYKKLFWIVGEKITL